MTTASATDAARPTGQPRNLSPVSAWRCFTLGQDGTLWPPYAARYMPLQTEDIWTAGTNFARCVASDHHAPGEHCTCGLRGMTEFRALVEFATRHDPRDSEPAILDDRGVIGRVKLAGLIYPGIYDDPPTTLRASGAVLLEVYLPERFAGDADAVRERYVPATVRVISDWPMGADPEAAFWRDLRAVGFGQKDPTDPKFLAVARGIVDSVRRGMTITDGVSGLFHSTARPTVQQARTLVESAIDNFAPELRGRDDGLIAGEQITLTQSLVRDSASPLLRAVR